MKIQEPCHMWKNWRGCSPKALPRQEESRQVGGVCTGDGKRAGKRHFLMLLGSSEATVGPIFLCYGDVFRVVRRCPRLPWGSGVPFIEGAQTL